MSTEPQYQHPVLKRHRWHSTTRRAILCVILLSVVLGIGVLGVCVLEGYAPIDAFYFVSLIATGQGPAPGMEIRTTAGKLFVAFISFVSVGSLITSLGFLFGPFFGMLWRLGSHKLDHELHYLSEQVRNKK